ncbi:hypothetical protein BJ138DRAFT_1006008 [Hygrophoropsis aurantiaca]|uniref:Uncharacterized protein n=1 Tax=Hygrophoropsis aurantiaca TaxID=72124 RepID=A0ACB8AE76_9AGAM|nr:hypothetical protein BJ138DRAFT_1006008 [Hygrophoropsis aurantiaca]
MSFILKPSVIRILPSCSRSIQQRAALRPTPLATIGSISTPQDFLKRIGRSSETKFDAENWDSFWRTSGIDLKKAGLSVQDRRYILWCMEKFRQHGTVDGYAHEMSPKKKIRGRGPAVQFGKRIRSRRER